MSTDADITDGTTARGSDSKTFAIQAAITIFLGAFLLFQVQPIISKMILPWFGGTPAVWTTAMLFFQVMLLAGYAYAHLLSRFGSPAMQGVVHVVLLVAAVLMLPITPGEEWKPLGQDGSPAPQILLLLLVCVGLPYFVLASTGPLIQSWFARWYPDRSPYRLYALSNVGSLGALLSYPFVIEPNMTIPTQGFSWLVGFVVYAICCGGMAIVFWRAVPRPLSGRPLSGQSASDQSDGVREGVAALGLPAADTASASRYALWFALPFVPSVMLLAVTNHLCLDVAVIPFLWILPMSLYLISFILCFDSEIWYRRTPFAVAAIVSVLFLSASLQFVTVDEWIEAYIPALGVSFMALNYNIFAQATAWLVMLFSVCMLCHGEVVRLKPAPRQLTAFYLSISAGGALGGIFVGVVCPFLFSEYAEVRGGIVVTAACALLVLFGAGWNSWLRRIWIRVPAILLGIALVGLIGTAQSYRRFSNYMIHSERNFYGPVRVHEYTYMHEGQLVRDRQFVHGQIVHGKQILDVPTQQEPVSYYGPDSGIALALRRHQPDQPHRIGVMGLGVGTIAAFGRPGDTIRFYEINPAVLEIANEYFTYLSDSQATIEHVPGDARLSMEYEQRQNYDLLVMDGFSSDAIPIHLITDEAVELYKRHLKPDGILAFNITNIFLRLEPIVARLAEKHDLHFAIVTNRDDTKRFISGATWALLSRADAIFSDPEVAAAVERSAQQVAPGSLWTDDYSNLFETIRW